MRSILVERIKSRLEATGKTAFKAALDAGKERSFLHEIIIGKKHSIRQGNIPAVAEALDCDPEYLLGQIDTPRSKDKPDNKMTVVGLVQSEKWYAIDDFESSRIELTPDPAYPPEEQVAYLTRGDHGEAFGIKDGDLLLVVTEKAPLRTGDLIVFRRRNAMGHVETSVRRLNGISAETGGREDQRKSSFLSDGEVVGRVIRAITFF